jgi:hypothetical protein
MLTLFTSLQPTFAALDCGEKRKSMDEQVAMLSSLMLEFKDNATNNDFFFSYFITEIE